MKKILCLLILQFIFLSVNLHQGFTLAVNTQINQIYENSYLRAKNINKAITVISKIKNKEVKEKAISIRRTINKQIKRYFEQNSKCLIDAVLKNWPDKSILALIENERGYGLLPYLREMLVSSNVDELLKAMDWIKKIILLLKEDENKIKILLNKKNNSILERLINLVESKDKKICLKAIKVFFDILDSLDCKNKVKILKYEFSPHYQLKERKTILSILLAKYEDKDADNIFLLMKSFMSLIENHKQDQNQKEIIVLLEEYGLASKLIALIGIDKNIKKGDKIQEEAMENIEKLIKSLDKDIYLKLIKEMLKNLKWHVKDLAVSIILNLIETLKKDQILKSHCFILSILEDMINESSEVRDEGIRRTEILITNVSDEDKMKLLNKNIDGHSIISILAKRVKDTNEEVQMQAVKSIIEIINSFNGQKIKQQVFQEFCNLSEILLSKEEINPLLVTILDNEKDIIEILTKMLKSQNTKVQKNVLKIIFELIKKFKGNPKKKVFLEKILKLDYLLDIAKKNVDTINSMRVQEIILELVERWQEKKLSDWLLKQKADKGYLFDLKGYDNCMKWISLKMIEHDDRKIKILGLKMLSKIITKNIENNINNNKKTIISILENLLNKEDSDICLEAFNVLIDIIESANDDFKKQALRMLENKIDVFDYFINRIDEISLTKQYIYLKVFTKLIQNFKDKCNSKKIFSYKIDMFSFFNNMFKHKDGFDEYSYHESKSVIEFLTELICLEKNGITTRQLMNNLIAILRTPFIYQDETVKKIMTRFNDNQKILILKEMLCKDKGFICLCERRIKIISELEYEKKRFKLLAQHLNHAHVYTEARKALLNIINKLQEKKRRNVLTQMLNNKKWSIQAFAIETFLTLMNKEENQVQTIIDKIRNILEKKLKKNEDNKKDLSLQRKLYQALIRLISDKQTAEKNLIKSIFMDKEVSAEGKKYLDIFEEQNIIDVFRCLGYKYPQTFIYIEYILNKKKDKEKKEFLEKVDEIFLIDKIIKTIKNKKSDYKITKACKDIYIELINGIPTKELKQYDFALVLGEIFKLDNKCRDPHMSYFCNMRDCLLRIILNIKETCEIKTILTYKINNKMILEYIENDFAENLIKTIDTALRNTTKEQEITLIENIELDGNYKKGYKEKVLSLDIILIKIWVLQKLLGIQNENYMFFKYITIDELRTYILYINSLNKLTDKQKKILKNLSKLYGQIYYIQMSDPGQKVFDLIRLKKEIENDDTKITKQDQKSKTTKIGRKRINYDKGSELFSTPIEIYENYIKENHKNLICA